jgi:tetratricopeptide (TPR) repeat protein
MNLNIPEITPRPLLPFDRMYLDVPTGIRFVLLMSLLRRKELSIEEWLPYYREANRIYNKLIIRQQEAEKLEELGELAKAIELYEQNIEDFYHNRDPYTKLFSIYREKQQPIQAKRICESFLNMVEIIGQIDPIYKSEFEFVWGADEFREKLKLLAAWSI